MTAEEIEKSLVISTTSEVSLVPEKQVREEAAQAAARMADAYSKNTQRAYRAAWRIFEGWLAERGLVPAASTAEIVATYLEWRLSHGLGARACVREYGALAAHLREIQPEGPWRSKSPPEIIQRWLKGAKKTAAPMVSKEPLKPEHFVRLAESRVSTTLIGVRNRALLLFGFAGGFRRSELVALDVADVRFGPEGAVAIVRRSKTDQDGEGRQKAVWRQQGVRCPVAALETYLALAKIEEGPVFRVVRNGRATRRRMYDKTVAVIVKEAVMSIGLDPRKYAGHSLRSGFVTAAAERGATIDEIMNTTHHRSADQVVGYIKRATPFERNASKGLLDSAEPVDEAEEELRCAIDIKVERGPKGGIKRVSYTIPAHDGQAPHHVGISAWIPSSREHAMAVLAFFKEHNLPIEDVNTTSTHFACANGHSYDARFVGKYCVQGACKDGARQDPARRIEER